MPISKFLGMGVVRPAPVKSVDSESTSITDLLEYMHALGESNSSSYRLLKTALSKLKEFKKLNKQDEKKI